MNFTFTRVEKAGTGELPGLRLFREHMALHLRRKMMGGYNPRCTWNHRVKPGDTHCFFGHRISGHAVSTDLDIMTSDRQEHEMIVAYLLGEVGQRWMVQEVITGWGPGSTDKAPKPGRWSAGNGWRPYSGRSKHLDHVHLSLHPTAARWTSPPPPPPVYVPLKPTPAPTAQEIEEDAMRLIVVNVPCNEHGSGWARIPDVTLEQVLGDPFATFGWDFRECTPEMRVTQHPDGFPAVHVSRWFPNVEIGVKVKAT
jgi:hypothetical protein